MWLVVNPHTGPGQWWPQGGGRIDSWEGVWYGQARIGREGEEDIGDEFDIAIILVDEEDDLILREWVKTTTERQKWQSISLPDSATFGHRITVTRKSTSTTAPTPTTAPTTSTTPYTIDTMDSTSGWSKYNDNKGSSINIKSIPGRTNKALEITYDLKEWGWVTLNKRIDPNILSEIERIQFFYKGTGKPNTIEFKLMYSDGAKYDGTETTFGYLINAATVKDDWTLVEVPYESLECWWSQESCADNPELDLRKVSKIEFAISNKPDKGDEYGSGKVIIDDVQGTTPPSSFVVISEPEEKDEVSWRYMVEGSSSATEDSGLSVYVLIWTVEAEEAWRVQPTTTFSDGSWQSYAYFGREDMDIGVTFRVVAILTTQNLSAGQAFIVLPDYDAKSKEILVTRI